MGGLQTVVPPAALVPKKDRGQLSEECDPIHGECWDSSHALRMSKRAREYIVAYDVLARWCEIHGADATVPENSTRLLDDGVLDTRRSHLTSYGCSG
jgi:hypothetical protein